MSPYKEKGKYKIIAYVTLIEALFKEKLALEGPRHGTDSH